MLLIRHGEPIFLHPYKSYICATLSRTEVQEILQMIVVLKNVHILEAKWRLIAAIKDKLKKVKGSNYW